MSASPHPPRRAALAKVHMAKKALGLEDDDYRDVVEAVTGHRSAADCSDVQLGRLIQHFKARGFSDQPRKPARTAFAPAAKPRPATHPVALKARAMWLSLHQLGVVHDPAESALEAFAARQLKVQRLQWADRSQGYRLIEALKAMAERAGWSQDGSLDEIKDRLGRLLEERRGDR